MTEQPDSGFYVPAIVQKMAKNLIRNTSYTPVITQPGDQQWCITLSNERVLMTMDYRRKSGKVRWVASQLLVDGQPRKLADCANELESIMQNPDGTLVLPAFTSLVPMTDVGEVPPIVQYHYRLLARYASDDTIDLQLGMVQGNWAINLGIDDGGMRLNFKQTGGKQWGLDPEHPIQIVIDGIDRSRHAGGSIDKGLAVLLGSLPTTPAAASPATTKLPQRQ